MLVCKLILQTGIERKKESSQKYGILFLFNNFLRFLKKYPFFACIAMFHA
jgi:hypothetical protein